MNLAEGKTIQRVEIVPVVEVIQAAAQILAQEVGWGQVGVNILNEDVIIHKVPVVPISMIKYLLLLWSKKSAGSWVNGLFRTLKVCVNV